MTAFGLSRDPRVRERLLAWRDERGLGLSGETTGILAMLGDEAARRAWGAFPREARTFLLDGPQDGRLSTMDGDPERTARWVARTDANRCCGWHAQAVIEAEYPTFSFPHDPGWAARARHSGERGFEQHRGRFVPSAILDGWIPVAR